MPYISPSLTSTRQPSCTDDLIVTDHAFSYPNAWATMHHTPPLPPTPTSASSTSPSTSQVPPFPSHIPPFPPTDLNATASGPSSQPMGRTYSRPISHAERSALRQAVYIIRCANCDNFLTDRGMKAVLLLKPHVPLFSTDASPSNCSAIYAPEPLLGDLPQHQGPKERSCACFTQTLGCHECGTPVGYSVVKACAKCSSNVSKHSGQGANGHRIVFHCTGIKAHVRRYVPGDGGVVSMKIPSSLNDWIRDSVRINARLQDLHSTSPASPSEAENLVSHEKQLVERLRMLQQQIWLVYARLREEYTAGARIILQGETVYWSDLLSLGGERTQPFDPDTILDPAVGR